MTRKALLLAGLALAASCGTLLADGAGGMFLGYYMGGHPLVQHYNLPSNAPDLMYFGGYGYGVARRGVMNGGFGLAYLDSEGTSGAAGGMGGFITGLRILRAPLHLALVSWTGVGGWYTGRLAPSPKRGYFVGMEEVDFEVGLPIAPWFMPTAFVGYQVVGNLVPGLPFRSSLTYTPVAGIRLAWGRFW
jgi:hypothetical protein